MSSQTRSSFRPGRIVALVIGSLLILPALGMLAAGTVLVGAHAFARDSDGYFTASLDDVATPTAAVTAGDVDLTVDPGSPGWLVDRLDADVRLAVTDTSGAGAIFVGIGPERDVEAYLAGVAHDELTDIVDGDARYRRRTGADTAPPPTAEAFWVASASGSGTQRLTWEATDGQWAVVVMNADGSSGVATDVTAGVRAPFVLPLGLILLGVGLVATAIGVILIVAGALGAARHPAPPPEATGPVDAGAPAGTVVGGERRPIEPVTPGPVRLEATLEPDLSRGLWLVKWLMALPHVIVLVFLWIAFAVLTVVAGVAILFTGRYPRSLFDFNVGVLRWHWRVSYYASTGGLGTDRYPPFSLGPEPDYPARLDVAYPGPLNRWLVLVKWWLLAIPHYLILGAMIGGSAAWVGGPGDDGAAAGPGLLPILVVVAAVILLFTSRYPQALFNLIIGLNRWSFRVLAYAALMTDSYPPFRLDQGGAEPGTAPNPPPPAPAPTSVAAPPEPVAAGTSGGDLG